MIAETGSMETGIAGLYASAPESLPFAPTLDNSATAERVLGVDMSGWHAVSGFLVAVPALLLASQPHLVARLLPLAAGGLIATAVWALFSIKLAGGLFYFPNNGTDALLHFATAAIFLAGSAHYFVGERRSAR
jgi:Domain of unknown function (DUF4383)